MDNRSVANQVREIICRLCDKPIRPNQDYFYGKHADCVRLAVNRMHTRKAVDGHVIGYRLI